MKQNIKNFLKYKDLLKELIVQEIRLKYKNSVLGILWSMLDPLLTMMVLTIVFGSVFKRDIPNFPVYVLLGRLVYSFFSQSTKAAMGSVLANKQLIKKIYVPKYFFPVAKVFSSFIVFLMSFIPLIGIMIVMDVKFHLMNLLVVFPLLYVLGIALGIGLFLASIRFFFGDIKHIYSVGLLIIMYMTPIFYPAEIIPQEYMGFILMNPLFTILNMFRDILMYNTIPTITNHMLCIAYVTISLGIGMTVFYKTQDRFIFHL